MSYRRFIVSMVALFVIGFSTASSAQDFAQFFSVSTPGARANGMGRAFVGIADDASAAVTNPAGLMFLTRPQVYAEFKSSFYDQQDPFGGDTIQFKSLRARLPFIAVSAPIGDRVSVAFSRHEFFGGDFTIGSSEFKDRGTSYSGSVATTVRPDLKVGVTLSGGTVSVDGESDQTAFGFTIGGLWQANDMISLGVSGTKWSGSSSLDTFVAPSQIRFGVGLTPMPQWKLAVDVVRVAFPSDLAEDDTQFHLGGEYQLMPIGQNKIFLRAGVYTGKESRFDVNANNVTETKTTGTFGAGVVVGQQLQVDLAVLTRKEVVLSAAVRF